MSAGGVPVNTSMPVVNPLYTVPESKLAVISVHEEPLVLLCHFIVGVEDNAVPSYGNDIYGDFEPTTIEMSSSFDGSGDKKVLLSVVIGIGVGALALYLAKKKGWI